MKKKDTKKNDKLRRKARIKHVRKAQRSASRQPGKPTEGHRKCEPVRDSSRPTPGDIIVLYIARSLGETMKDRFGLSDPDGFCWIGVESTFFRRLAELPCGSPPLRVPVRVVLVMSEDQRFDLDDIVFMNFERNEAGLIGRLEGDQVFDIRILPPREVENDLQVLGNALREELIPDSHIFIGVSIEGEKYEVVHGITCGEAKAYRAPFLQAPAVA